MSRFTFVMTRLVSATFHKRVGTLVQLSPFASARVALSSSAKEFTVELFPLPVSPRRMSISFFGLGHVLSGSSSVAHIFDIGRPMGMWSEIILQLRCQSSGLFDGGEKVGIVGNALGRTFILGHASFILFSLIGATRFVIGYFWGTRKRSEKRFGCLFRLRCNEETTIVVCLGGYRTVAL